MQGMAKNATIIGENDQKYDFMDGCMDGRMDGRMDGLTKPKLGVAALQSRLNM